MLFRSSFFFFVFSGFFFFYFDDSAITAKVKTKLLDDELVRGTAISVETLKGTVLLSGFAKSRQEIAQAESIAKRVHGVREVRNQIVLRP